MFNVTKDPFKWSVKEVSIWLNWIAKQYSLINFNIPKFKVNGSQLFSETFCWNTNDVKNIPPNNDFWIHISLLRKLKCVFIKLKNDELVDIKSLKKMKEKTELISKLKTNVEIWQFFLHLLSNKDYQEIIEWIDDNGHFRLIKPKTVSILWGIIKNNITMDYKKMSSSIRYHYGKGIINRAKGKHVYKFESDVKMLVGYTPMEIKKTFANQ
ncbi:ETS-like protein pointed isoform X2 [Daktulosphaira vitifoliae]|nr:ETS-like protein pointed isoform X2 [Daktulosphaira vitifoliae]